MARFEVSDRFAGKKGPCPKCGHIIEIPKENVVIQNPDEMMVGGKKVKNPDYIRPIEQKTFSFTGRAILVNLVTIAVVLLIATVFHFIHCIPIAIPVGILLSLAVAFPLLKYGYMTFRDPNDLEIFLGGTLGKKSAIGAVGFVVFWLLFEILLLYMNQGGFAWVYLIPVAFLMAFIPIVLFDLKFTDALAIAAVFALAAVLLRGIMFADNGWIWKYRYSDDQTVPAAAPAVPSATDNDEEAVEEEEEIGNLKPAPVPVQRLNKNAPDPTKNLRRR